MTNAASSKNAASVSANCGVEIDTHYHADTPPTTPQYRPTIVRFIPVLGFVFMTLDLTKISLTMTRTLDLRYLTHLTTTISIDVMTLHLRDLMKMTMMRMTSTNPDQDVSSDIAFNEILDYNFPFPIALDVEM